MMHITYLFQQFFYKEIDDSLEDIHNKPIELPLVAGYLG